MCANKTLRLVCQQIIAFVFFITLFSSCRSQKNNDCIKDYKQAENTINNYSISGNKQSLDSGLKLLKKCLTCDGNVRKAAIDFMTRILITVHQYSAGVKFIDSLKENDFVYAYKKRLFSNYFRALNYGLVKDTINQKLIFIQICNDLEQYLRVNNLSKRESQQVYIDLFMIKRNFLNVKQINEEVDSLQKLYPEKSAFFKFFKM